MASKVSDVMLGNSEKKEALSCCDFGINPTGALMYCRRNSYTYMTKVKADMRSRWIWPSWCITAPSCKVSEELKMPLVKVKRWTRWRKSNASADQRMACLEAVADTALFNSAFLVVLTLVLLRQEWFWTVDACWSTYPVVAVSGVLLTLYRLYLAHHIATIVLMLQNNPRDQATLLGHFFTASLAAIGWIVNLTRFSLLVIWVHGLGKIHLDALKLAQIIDAQQWTRRLSFVLTLVYPTTQVWILVVWLLWPFWDRGLVFTGLTPAISMSVAALWLVGAYNLFHSTSLVKNLVNKLATPETVDDSEVNEDA